jgi:hypothetical protein
MAHSVVEQIKNQALIAAGVVTVSAITSYATGYSAVGYMTAAACGSYFYSQPATTSSRCLQIFLDTLEKVKRFFHSFPLTPIPITAVALSSSAGTLIAHVIGFGMGGRVVGCAVGGFSMLAVLNRNGYVRSIEPLPLPVDPNRFEVTTDSLLHLDSPITLGVYFGDLRTINPIHRVACPSAGSAIECAKLLFLFRKQHRSFFERAGRTADECRAFILTRPANEFDPNLDPLAEFTNYYNRMKFDILPVQNHPTGTPKARPPQSESQKRCRDALVETDVAEIIYPRATITDDIINLAVRRAVKQAFKEVRIEASFNPATPPEIVEGVLEGAQIFARGVVRAVADAGMREGQFQAGSLNDGALFAAHVARAAAPAVARAVAAVMPRAALHNFIGQFTPILAHELTAQPLAIPLNEATIIAERVIENIGAQELTIKIARAIARSVVAPIFAGQLTNEISALVPPQTPNQVYNTVNQPAPIQRIAQAVAQLVTQEIAPVALTNRVLAQVPGRTRSTPIVRSLFARAVRTPAVFQAINRAVDETGDQRVGLAWLVVSQVYQSVKTKALSIAHIISPAEATRRTTARTLQSRAQITAQDPARAQRTLPVLALPLSRAISQLSGVPLGVQANLEAVLDNAARVPPHLVESFRYTAGRPVVALAQDPVDMAYLLTTIRNQVIPEVIAAQEVDRTGAAVPPAPPFRGYGNYRNDYDV